MLELIGATPELRRALVETVRVVGPDDRAVGGPSYSAWWIRERVLLPDGEPLAGRADPDADPVLAEFLDEAPDWTARLDPEIRTAIGLVREVGESALLRLWNHLGQLTVYAAEPPTHIRVLAGEGGKPVGDEGEVGGPDGGEGEGGREGDGGRPGEGGAGGVGGRALPTGRTAIVAAGEAVVADSPMWLQRGDLGGFVVAWGVVADGLSDLLDLPMAQEVAEGKIDGAGTAADVPEIVRELVPETPQTWWEHEELTVDGIEVSWWVNEGGEPHAATFNGLAKALAWAAGCWDQRHVILAILTDPTRASELLIDAAFDRHTDDNE